MILKAIRNLKKFNDTTYYIVYFCVDVPINIIILELLSGRVVGVYYGTLTIVLFSIICSVINIFFDKRVAK